MSESGLFWCTKTGRWRKWRGRSWRRYSNSTQQWVKTSMKSAGVTPPDCKPGKT